MTHTWNHDRHPVGHCPCKAWMRISKGRKKNLERTLLKVDIYPYLKSEKYFTLEDYDLQTQCACVRCGERMDPPSSPETFADKLYKMVSKYPDLIFCDKCLAENLGHTRFCSRCGLSANLKEYLRFHLIYARHEDFPRVLRILLTKWKNPKEAIYCENCHIELMSELGNIISYSFQRQKKKKKEETLLKIGWYYKK